MSDQVDEETVDSEFQEKSPDNRPSAVNEADTLRIIEALLFASDELLSPARLKAIVPGAPDARLLRKMIDKINVQLQKERHPFEIVEIGGGYQFRTVSYYHPWVRQIFKDKAAKKLSIQALECLAIIAYKQPLSKAEIEAIRGVVSDGAMKTLLEKRLVTISGRSEKPGRPLLYATTQEFLTYFGLNKIVDLPRIEEFEAIAREKMEDLTTVELQKPETNTEEETFLLQQQEAAAKNEQKAQTETRAEPENTAMFEVSIPSEEKKPGTEPITTGTDDKQVDNEEVIEEVEDEFEVEEYTGDENLPVIENINGVEADAEEEAFAIEEELLIEGEYSDVLKSKSLNEEEADFEVDVADPVEKGDDLSASREVGDETEQVDHAQIQKLINERNAIADKFDQDEEVLEVDMPEKQVEEKKPEVPDEQKKKPDEDDEGEFEVKM